MNGLGLIAASQVNARLVGRFGPARLLRGALACVVVRRRWRCSSSSRSAGWASWAVLVADVRRSCRACPFVLPNTTALALADHAAVAGTASALLGVIQFMVGALAAPLVGVAGTD